MVKYPDTPKGECKFMADHKRKSVRLPSKGIYNTAMSVLGLRAKGRHKAKYDRSGLEGVEAPYVVLSNHCSVNDWYLVGEAFLPERLNFVVTRHFYSNPLLEPLFWRVGAIPKDQFTPDVGTIKDILTAAKAGGNVMIFPEGRMTPHGRTETIEKSTVKLLKKLKMPVMALHMDGAYLTRPKWSKVDRKGRVDIKTTLLFTPRQLKEMSDDELYDRMKEVLTTDDFAWQKENRVRFRGGKFAEGLENLLYACPKCGGMLTTVTKGNKIECCACGNGAKLNNYYEFEKLSQDCVIPENIADWFDLLKKKETEAILSDENFEMRSHVVIRRPYRKKLEWLSEVGDGTLILNRNGLRFEGTQDGQPFELEVPTASMPALAFGCNQHVTLYKDGEYYSFVPDNRQESVRWSVVAELLYNLQSEKE